MEFTNSPVTGLDFRWLSLYPRIAEDDWFTRQ